VDLRRQRLVGAGPERLEVFGRKERAGWHVIGDELPNGYVSASGEMLRSTGVID